MSTPSTPTQDLSRPGRPARRAYRALDDAYLGGVAAGLAQHLGLPIVWVRLAFIVLTLFGGFGVFLYAAFWVVLPAAKHFDDDAPGLAAATRQGKRSGGPVRALADAGSLVALGALVLGVVALVAALTGGAVVLWPVALATVGVAVLWRQADQVQRERWLDSSARLGPLRLLLGSGGWASWARIVAGVLFLVAAIALFAIRGGNLGVARDAVIAALLGIAGVALMVGPWLYRLSTDLTEERAERIRSQERADVAAHLHDSVLQTLALIQKTAHDPAQVSRLARSQERDLRSWLYASEDVEGTTLAAACRRAAAEVEDDFGVPIEVVHVGTDLPLTEPMRPIVHAAREAMVNASKHSGADQIDVFVERVGDAVEIFVRDRGSGFDLDVVPDDRHGVRDSILDRMRRHGGTADVRSTPGSGTEVRLALPLTDRAGDQTGDQTSDQTQEATR